jgi:hypothetical protein
VCEYFGGIHPRSLHRWKTLLPGFPQPAVINKRDYYDPDEIETFALKHRAIAEHEAAKKLGAAQAANKPEAQPEKPEKTKRKATKPKPKPAEKPARRSPRRKRAIANAEPEFTTENR